MIIKVIIINSGKKQYEPERYHFEGNYAFEIMIRKLLTIYYGERIAIMVEDLLKSRINGGN